MNQSGKLIITIAGTLGFLSVASVTAQVAATASQPAAQAAPTASPSATPAAESDSVERIRGDGEQA